MAVAREKGGNGISERGQREGGKKRAEAERERERDRQTDEEVIERRRRESKRGESARAPAK